MQSAKALARPRLCAGSSGTSLLADVISINKNKISCTGSHVCEFVIFSMKIAQGTQVHGGHFVARMSCNFKPRAPAVDTLMTPHQQSLQQIVTLLEHLCDHKAVSYDSHFLLQ